MATFIIAEVGVNHNGDVTLAEELIKAAANAGCDAVKFQTFRTENLVTKTAEKAKYQEINTETSESQFEMLKKLELTSANFQYLKEVCEEYNIEFMSTPFDEESVVVLENLNIKTYKISSGDLTNKRLLECVAKTGKDIILSTGMATEEEIEEALNWIKKSGNNSITLLHCTSNYPTSYEDVNMNAMIRMKEKFHIPVGYSDHTLGIEVPIMAVAMGAQVIEKHITLSKEMQGPDHAASLDINELTQMVKGIRNIEKAFGNGQKTACKSELDTRLVARKSIVVTKDLLEGHVLTKEDLELKRPGDGIPPKYLEMIPGKKLMKNVKADTTLHFEDIEQ